MTSSKLSSRRQTRGTPPVCRAPLPPYPPYAIAAGPDQPHKDYISACHLPPCPDPPYQPIQLRHLIFHLYPHRATDAATRALHQLRLRWDIFNGRKLIALATDSHTMPLGQVKRLLPSDAEWLIIPNDPRLRETASFPTLLREVRSTDHRTATFYGHSKGASPTHHHNRPKLLAITYWTLRMFHHLLDDWPAVDDALRTHATAGCYKIDYSHHPGYTLQSPTGARGGTWFYAGTFFWFRHDIIYRNPAWSAIPDDSFAPEIWLGSFIPSHLAATLYQPWHPNADHRPDPYEPATHSPPVPGPTA